MEAITTLFLWGLLITLSMFVFSLVLYAGMFAISLILIGIQTIWRKIV